MVIVKPGETVEQRVGETVVYQLRFSDWSEDLERADDRNARITQQALFGDPLRLQVLPRAPGMLAHEISITGNGASRGQYIVTRTVRSKTEKRVRSFTLRMQL